MNRRFRLLAALGIAFVLSTFMIYTALAGTDVQEPVVEMHELQHRADVASSTTVELVGVAAGPIEGTPGERITFFLTDRDGGSKTRVTYSGSVPDAFRVGRHVIVKGRLHDEGGVREFRADADSLVTKCPSRFESADGSARSST